MVLLRGDSPEEKESLPPAHQAAWYPSDPSSIPRATQELWLNRPSTPLVDKDVFARRRNFVNADLHVLLIDADKVERFKLKQSLDTLGYHVSSVPSGAAAQQVLLEQPGAFHVVMVDAKLQGEGLDCVGLLSWARQVTALKEVAFIVTGKELTTEASVLMVKLGATNLLLKPIPQEELIRMRKTCTKSQSLQQQRLARREQGGARAVTNALVERQMALGGKGGGRASSPTSDEAEPAVLLVHREPESSDCRKLIVMLKACGFRLGIARSSRDALRALREHEWPSLVLLDFQHDESAAHHLLREMAHKMIALPVVGVLDDKSTDGVVKCMRSGVCEVIFHPLTRPRAKQLLQHILSAAERDAIIKQMQQAQQAQGGKSTKDLTGSKAARDEARRNADGFKDPGRRSEPPGAFSSVADAMAAATGEHGGRKATFVDSGGPSSSGKARGAKRRGSVAAAVALTGRASDAPPSLSPLKNKFAGLQPSDSDLGFGGGGGGGGGGGESSLDLLLEGDESGAAASMAASVESSGGRDDLETPSRRSLRSCSTVSAAGGGGSAAQLRKLSTPDGGTARRSKSMHGSSSPSTPSPKGAQAGSSSAHRLFTPPGVIAAVTDELEPAQVEQLLSAASSRLIRAQTPPATLHGALAELRLTSPQPLLPLGASLEELAARHARGADNGLLPDLSLGARPVTAPEGLTGALRRNRAKGPPVVPPLPLSQSGASGGLEGVGALRATLRERAAEEEALKQAAANALTTAQQLRGMVEQAEQHAESEAVRAVLRTRHEEADRAVLLLKAKLRNFQRNAKQRDALDALSSSPNLGGRGGSRGGARPATTTPATAKPSSPATKPSSPVAASTGTSDDATSWPWGSVDEAAAAGGTADASTGVSRPGTAATSTAMPAAAPAAAAASAPAVATLPQGASASHASDAVQTLQRSKSAANWNIARDNVAQVGKVPFDTPPASLLVYGGEAFGKRHPKPDSDDDDRDHRAQLMAWRDSMLDLMKRELAGEVEVPKPPDLLRYLTMPKL